MGAKLALCDRPTELKIKLVARPPNKPRGAVTVTDCLRTVPKSRLLTCLELSLERKQMPQTVENRENRCDAMEALDQNRVRPRQANSAKSGATTRIGKILGKFR